MAVEIWPHVAPDQLKVAIESAEVRRPALSLPSISPALSQARVAMDKSWVLIEHVFTPSKQKRELDWLIEDLHETLTHVKHGLEDCYALLAPVDPGSTLVLSTPRNEVVKGHVTRVGTRIVKGVCLSLVIPSNSTELTLVHSDDPFAITHSPSSIPHHQPRPPDPPRASHHSPRPPDAVG